MLAAQAFHASVPSKEDQQYLDLHKRRPPVHLAARATALRFRHAPRHAF
jgi:hypothetical protein